MRRETVKSGVLWTVLAAAALALVTLPEEAMEAAREGLRLCGELVVPSLFPFFILSSLMVDLGLASALGRVMGRWMSPLFGVRGAGASALVLGLIGGYPVGARTALALYQSGQCTREEAERLLCFCNNSGPAFILGVAGAGVFRSTAVGLLLYGVHIAAALAVGVLFRLFCPRRTEENGAAPSAAVSAVGAAEAFTSAVQGAVTSSLNICGFVVCFRVLLRLLTETGVLTLLARSVAALPAPLGLEESWAVRLLAGLLELSTGIAALAGQGGLTGRVVLASFLLGWGGLSVHCQTAALLKGSGLRTAGGWIGKLLHGLLSVLLSALACRVVFREPLVEAFAPAADALTELPNLWPGSLTLTLAAVAAALLFLRKTVKKSEFRRQS